MKIIVGLGNPDKKYKTTRHNLGFIALDKIAKQENLEWQYDKKFKADIIKTTDKFLVKPTTYMNNSGESVLSILDYYELLERNEEGKIIPNADLQDSLIVIHDELDIDLGKYKFSVNSSSAGHRGVQNIIDLIKTQNFTRVRIGIKTDKLEKMPSDKFVLKKMPKAELKIIDDLLSEILVNF